MPKNSYFFSKCYDVFVDKTREPQISPSVLFVFCGSCKKKGVKNKGKYAKEIVEITCAGHRVAVLNTLSN